jgi:hypothetical protein
MGARAMFEEAKHPRAYKSTTQRGSTERFKNPTAYAIAHDAIVAERRKRRAAARRK